ncbi:heat-inducible transcription repressor HrcA [bacterium]|nr:heat-inducible transcription repressor HrcA [bacterium]
MKTLDKRRKEILWAIIQSHVELNVPIGSMLVHKRYSIDVSPATIRNIMVTLEDMGYIAQPHTSAGRVPTEEGYKFYVDMLMNEQDFTMSTILSEELAAGLRGTERNSTILIKEAARTLSDYTQCLALITPPNRVGIIMKRIKFIRFESRKALVLIIAEDGTINNRVIHLDNEHSQQQLDEAAAMLSRKFHGLPIERIAEKLAYQLYKDKQVYNELIESLISYCNDISMHQAERFPFHDIAGTSNLLDFATLGQIKEILRAIENKEFMLTLLRELNSAEGTRVLVGMKNILPAMSELSMVISTYSVYLATGGAVGIIGPTRMNYRELIPVVDQTAKALTDILSES